MELPLVQILVVVANNRMRSWRTEVEKGFVWTVVDHELVGPKFKAKAENFQVIKKSAKKTNRVNFVEFVEY